MSTHEELMICCLKRVLHDLRLQMSQVLALIPGLHGFCDQFRQLQCFMIGSAGVNTEFKALVVAV